MHPPRPSPPKQLPHRSAVVTGANRGLGFALAHQLALSGFSVLITARDVQNGEAAAATLASLGVLVEAHCAPLDVSCPSHMVDFASFCEHHSAPDVLINNAAICEPGWSQEVVRRTLATNVIGPLALMRAVLPGMHRRGHGRILNLSSGDGELVFLNSALQAEMRAVHTPRQLVRLLSRVSPPREEFGPSPAHGPTPAYSVSKAALNALTRVIVDQHPTLVHNDVWLGAACPGDVRTRMCSVEPAHAVTPKDAATDLVRLLTQQRSQPSGRFWRQRTEISM